MIVRRAGGRIESVCASVAVAAEVGVGAAIGGVAIRQTESCIHTIDNDRYSYTRISFSVQMHHESKL